MLMGFPPEVAALRGIDSPSGQGGGAKGSEAPCVNDRAPQDNFALARQMHRFLCCDVGATHSDGGTECAFRIASSRRCSSKRCYGSGSGSITPVPI